MSVCEVSVVAPQLHVKPWGGTRLAQFGLQVPQGESIGEALYTSNESIVTAGFGTDRSLGEIIAANPQARLGTLGMAAVGGQLIFPLLVKLIDASENLSIQVHPNDDLAAPLGKLGKTEAWHVLAAEADGALYLGLEDDMNVEMFMEHARLLDGTSATGLRRVNACVGDTWMIPAGTVHALGAGVMVYEIQQPSDVTFRLDDWGRLDDDGNPRQMHLEQGEQVIREHLRPKTIPGVRLDSANTREILTACRYFAVEKWNLPASSHLEVGQPGTPNVITVLSGTLEVAGHQLRAGESAVIWPGDTFVTCDASQKSIALRAWVPDLVQDIALPVRSAGGLDSDIAALGGMTGDLERLLG